MVEGRRKREDVFAAALIILRFIRNDQQCSFVTFLLYIPSCLRRRQCQTPSFILSLPTNISPNIIHVGFAAAKLLNIINITKGYLLFLTFLHLFSIVAAGSSRSLFHSVFEKSVNEVSLLSST